MKKTLKLIAVMLVMAMTLVMVPAISVSAEGAAADPNVILVGEGQTYTKISDAITGETADGLKGKTIKLTSDITEAAGNLTIALTGGGEVTIDGDGHTVDNFKTFITSSTTTELAVVTIKNIEFTRPTPDTANLGNHPIAYARGNSKVIFEDIVAIQGFNYIAGLHDSGNNHVVINSGVYHSNGYLVRANYNTCSKAAQSVVINGGNFYMGEKTTAVFCPAGNVAIDVNGGYFFSASSAPLVFDSGKYIGADGSMVTVTIDGATFVYPKNNDKLFAYNKTIFAGETPKTPATITIGQGNTFIEAFDGLASAADATWANSYGTAITAENIAYYTDVTVTPTKELTDTFGTAYLESGVVTPVNATILKAMNSPVFNFTYINITADTAAEVNLDNVTVAIYKNGKSVPGITSTNPDSIILEEAYTLNFANNTPMIQTKTNADGSISARVILPVASVAYSKAGVVYTKSADASALKYNNLGKYAEGVTAVETTDYYTSFIAAGITYYAGMLYGAEAIIILNIDGLAAGDTISFKAYGITAAGAEYSNARTYTIPAAQ